MKNKTLKDLPKTIDLNTLNTVTGGWANNWGTQSWKQPTAWKPTAQQ